MELPFGLYPNFYVKRKKQLFPLIEKYSGQKIRPDTPHGSVILLYYNLLKNDLKFRSEVDKLIIAQGSRLATGPQKKVLTDNSKNVVGIIAGITSLAASIFGGGQAKAASDTAFASVVLEQQKARNNQILLIVGGITLASLAVIGLGIYMAAKK